MNRLKQLQEFNIYESNNGFFYEPDFRHEFLKERIYDVLTTYKPEVVVKAGIGSGSLILDLISDHKETVLVVVEPSLKVIEKFKKDNSSNPDIKGIRFINGEFTRLPIDYYAADFIICVDNFDILESAPVVDEFRRALEFDGYLLFGGVVLSDDDLDGVYDDYMRMIFPLHNDYYLKDDLKTFLNLKDFSFIKGNMEFFDLNFADLTAHLKGLYDIPDDKADEFIETNIDAFKNLYKLEEKSIKLPYFTGLFLRRKIRIDVP